MNGILILMGALCLPVAAYGLWRARRSRTKDGLIAGDPGVYFEPWRYYLNWLLGLGGAILLIALGLVF